jgi:hypothetical protein
LYNFFFERIGIDIGKKPTFFLMFTIQIALHFDSCNFLHLYFNNKTSHALHLRECYQEREFLENQISGTIALILMFTNSFLREERT